MADERPAKRRRLSLESTIHEHHWSHSKWNGSCLISPATKRGVLQPASITLDSSSKLASQTIAPFLANHIPHTHNPSGLETKSRKMELKLQNKSDSKYCYRHRLNVRCRRQADEPSMDQLQKDIESLTPSDQQGIAHVWALFSAAPAKQRNLMLQGILTQCCFPQLSFLAAKTRELIKIDFMDALPTELAIKVLHHLDTTSLTKAAQVSKRWRELADDDVVWHRMCEQHIDRKCSRCGWGLPLLEQKRLMESKRTIEWRATKLALGTTRAELNARLHEAGAVDLPAATPASSLTRPWKDVYRDRFRVGCNWKHGRYTTNVLRGHTNGVMALQFNDNFLATGSYDTSIKIWDLDTGQVVRTLEGHTAGVRSLQFDDKMLVSGSLDKTLRVWDWHKGQCKKVFRGHESGVLSLHFDDKILASGSQDNTIRVRNFETKVEFCLSGHTDWVNCVKVDAASHTLFSASDDTTVRLWDLDSRRTVRVFEGHVGQVQYMLPLPREYAFDEEPCEDDHVSDKFASNFTTPDPESQPEKAGNKHTELSILEQSVARDGPPHYMLTGALDGTIRLWDVHSGKTLRTFFGHIEGVWALAADTLRFVSGAQDKSAKVWDARTGRCEGTFIGHAGPVTCIALGDSRMCTGSDDGDIRVYSFADGH